MIKITIQCIICGKKFVRYQVRFCSRNCYYKWQKKHPNKGCFKKGNTKGFQKGHKVFGGFKSRFKKGQTPWNKGTHIQTNNALEIWMRNGGIPANKGKHVKLNDALDKWRKAGNAIRGKDHWNWKNGASKLRDSIMALPEYKKWRKAVFERDNYTCRDCGKRGGKLYAHHKKELSKLLEKYNIKTSQDARECKALWNIGIGKTVCVSCHKEYHKALATFLP